MSPEFWIQLAVLVVGLIANGVFVFSWVRNTVAAEIRAERENADRVYARLTEVAAQRGALESIQHQLNRIEKLVARREGE